VNEFAFEKTIRRSRQQREAAVAILPALELRANNKAEEMKIELANLTPTRERLVDLNRLALDEIANSSDTESVRLALSSARTRLLIDPEDAEAHYVAGLSLLAMGDPNAAKEELLLVKGDKKSDFVRLATLIIEQL
jgi:hypothetical protein